MKPLFERIAQSQSVEVKSLLDSAACLTLKQLKKSVERQFDEETQELVDDGIFHVTNLQNRCGLSTCEIRLRNGLFLIINCRYILKKKHWDGYEYWIADLDSSRKIGLNRVLDRDDEDSDG